VDMHDNTINEVQAAIYSITTDGTFTNNIVTTTSAGVGNPPAGIYGMVIEGGTVTATGNTLTDDGTAGGYGLVSYAGYDGSENTDVTLTGNNVTGWDTGVSFDQCSTSCGTGAFTGITFNFNQITGNTTQFENLNVTPAVPGSPNWWGGAADPGFNLDEISYSPWCADQACTTFGYLANDTQDQLDALAPDSSFTLVPGVYDSLILSVPGTTLDIMDGVTIQPSAGPCFQINADRITIKGVNPGMAKCAPPTFYDGLDLLKPVSALVVQNLEFDGHNVNTLDGLNLGFNLSNFQFLNNYIHSFGRDGIRFTPNGTPSGSMVMAGNLFAKNSGYGLNNLTPVSLTSTYNGWNDVKGPTGTNGDGAGGKQTYKPFVNADLLMTTSGTKYAGKMTAGETLTVAVKVNAASLYGAQFDLAFDKDKLNLISITDSGKLNHQAGACVMTTSVATAQFNGLISYCGQGKLLNGMVTLYTLKFQVLPTAAMGDASLTFVPGTGIFSSNAAGPSNFVYTGSLGNTAVTLYNPSSGVYTLSGKVLLQGVDNSAGPVVQLNGVDKGYPGKWGDYTLTSLTSGTYTFSTTATAGYIDLPASLKKTITVNPGKSKINSLTLIAGDVNNDEVINLVDLTTIAANFGVPSFAPLADVNRDGTVNLLDLAIVAMNYNKNSVAYKSWKP
jgi:hypothetical protein